MTTTSAPRGTALTIFAILFGILAISNFSKPLEMGATTGFVFFGYRLHGTPNLLIAPLFGAYLAAMAYGIWTLKRWALPMVWIYLGYVILNLVLFRIVGPPMTREGVGAVIFGLVYMSIAIGVPLYTGILLRRRFQESRG